MTDIERLADELRIRSAIERYFFALDLRDREVLAACFADDVEVRYHTGTAGEFTQRGAATVVDYLIGNAGNYRSRTHSLANCHVVVRGDRAEATTNAVATLVRDGVIAVRGLRYVDDFARIDGAWRIARRRHQPLWQYDATPAELHIPAPALAAAAAQRRGTGPG